MLSHCVTSDHTSSQRRQRQQRQQRQPRQYTSKPSRGLGWQETAWATPSPRRRTWSGSSSGCGAAPGGGPLHRQPAIALFLEGPSASATRVGPIAQCLGGRHVVGDELPCWAPRVAAAAAIVELRFRELRTGHTARRATNPAHQTLNQRLCALRQLGKGMRLPGSGTSARPSAFNRWKPGTVTAKGKDSAKGRSPTSRNLPPRSLVRLDNLRPPCHGVAAAN